METFINIFTMGGGLALFLYGMSMLGNGLEKLSGGRMEKTLERLTSSTLKSLFFGILVTAAIQSSSATTVIVVGLVNAKILKLRNAIGVIMGANIGTTITSILLSLGDIGDDPNATMVMQMLKPSSFIPVVSVIGIIMYMSSKSTKNKIVAEIMLGFGILFNGMFIMTDAVKPYSDSPIFTEIFATLSNPLLGVLAGAIVTAILQSSSASVGILQAIADTGAINFSAALPIIMGQNIGTCITSLLSSVGANKNARRAAMVHLYFNAIGTLVFFAIAYSIANTVGFPFWNDPISMSGISNIHIVFNVATTVMFIPFIGVLEKLAVLTVRTSDDEQSFDGDVAILDERFLRSPSMALSLCNDVVQKMGEYAHENFKRISTIFEKYDPKVANKILEKEDIINKMEDKVNAYLVKIADHELTEKESHDITHILKLVSEFERIDDYTVALLELAKELDEKNAKLSKSAIKEVSIMVDAITEIINMTVLAFSNDDTDLAKKIEPIEEVVDKMEETLKNKHIERLRKGKCTLDSGLIFLEVLTKLERISDHCSNIAIYIINHSQNSEYENRRDYLKELYKGNSYPEFHDDIQIYSEKYLAKIKE